MLKRVGTYSNDSALKDLDLAKRCRVCCFEARKAFDCDRQPSVQLDTDSV
jgi:hypothetical protein